MGTDTTKVLRGTHRSELPKETNPWKEAWCCRESFDATQHIVVSGIRWAACEGRQIARDIMTQPIRRGLGWGLLHWKKYFPHIRLPRILVRSWLQQNWEHARHSSGLQESCGIISILLRAWARAFLAVRPFERQDQASSLVFKHFSTCLLAPHYRLTIWRWLGSLSLSMITTIVFTWRYDINLLPHWF